MAAGVTANPLQNPQMKVLQGQVCELPRPVTSWFFSVGLVIRRRPTPFRQPTPLVFRGERTCLGENQEGNRTDRKLPQLSCVYSLPKIRLETGGSQVDEA